eukprot:scaffold98432_cov33-Tisochrysis_lutea.AAC.2
MAGKPVVIAAKPDASVPLSRSKSSKSSVEGAAAPDLDVGVRDVLDSHPANICQPAIGLSAKGVSEQHFVRRGLGLERRRPHEPRPEVRSTALSVDAEACDEPISIEHMLESVAAALEVARPVAEKRA